MNNSTEGGFAVETMQIMCVQAQAQMVDLMEDIAQARQVFTAQRDGCAAQLDALAEEQVEYAQEQMQLIDHETANFAALQVQCPGQLCLSHFGHLNIVKFSGQITIQTIFSTVLCLACCYAIQLLTR